MKQIISFEKEIAFKTMIGEVTSISLEHTLSFQGPSTISGDMIVSGTYKMTEASTLEEDFQYAIPVDIMLTKELEEDNRSIAIHNFTYDIRNEDTLHLYIDVLVKGREVIELEEDNEEAPKKRKKKRVNAFMDGDENAIDYSDDDPEDEDSYEADPALSYDEDNPDDEKSEVEAYDAEINEIAPDDLGEEVELNEEDEDYSDDEVDGEDEE